MGRTLAGPGRLGSMKAMKKSLKGGAQSNVRNIPKEDSLTVRFLTNPEDWHGYYEHWMKDGPRPCTDDDCEGCESDDEKERKRLFRYMAPAYVVDDQKVQALKLPKTLVEQLVNFYQKYKTLLDRDYELSRTGSGQNDTRYMAVPEAPTKIKMARFEDKIPDLDEVLQQMLGDDDDDDDDDEKPAKKGKSASKPKKSKDDPWNDSPKHKTKKSGSKKTSVKRKVRR